MGCGFHHVLLGESWCRDREHRDKGRGGGWSPAPGKSQQHSVQERPWDLLPSQGCLQPGMWDSVVPLLSLNQPTELHCWRGVSEALLKNILMS